MLKSLLIVIMTICILPCSLFAQVDLDKIDDVFREMEEGALTLRFNDALNAEPIEGASASIENVGEYRTDHEGRVSFEIPGDGVYSVIFEKPGYIKSRFKIEVMAGSLFFNRFSVSPVMPLGSLRVVLDWGKNPRDLDAHFVKQGAYHISYRSMKSASDGSAKLDRDDTDSFGPETVTAGEVDENAVYEFYVHDYSNKNRDQSVELSKSKANVKVFGDNRLLHVFRIPQDEIGTYWKVFRIVEGQIGTVNEMAGAVDN